MQILTHSLFANYLPLIIYIAGFIVCLTGYRRLKRKIYLYATLFFVLNFLQKSWILPFSRYSTFPFDETFLTISSYINFGFMLLSLVTLGLLVWGFYREALLSYQDANNV